jgi:hypothetical protein
MMKETLQMVDYEQHAIGKCYPPLKEIEKERLRANLLGPGPKSKVILFEGKIFDGWNQYILSKELGIECEFEEVTPTDPIAYAVARNEGRRHLTHGQLTSIAEKLASLQWGSNRFKKVESHNGDSTDSEALTTQSQAITVEQAAKLTRTSPTAVGYLRQAKKRGIPEIAAAVEEGRLKVRSAARIADLPKAEQSEALAQAVLKKRRQKKTKPHLNGSVPTDEHERKTIETKVGKVSLGALGKIPMSHVDWNFDPDWEKLFNENFKSSWDKWQIDIRRTLKWHPAGKLSEKELVQVIVCLLDTWPVWRKSYAKIPVAELIRMTSVRFHQRFSI